MKKSKLKLFVFILFISIFVSGFTNISKTPNKVYRVYLAGKSLGLIESSDALDDYIDKEQEYLKSKYNVKKVYAPDDLDVKKEITYNNKISTVENIYKKIENKSPFTIDGYVITIKGLETKNEEGKKIKGKDQQIYVLDKKVFIDSVNNTINSFITKEKYQSYINDTQEKIKDTGENIENLYIKNNISIKKQRIPVNKTIYLDSSTLTKYLMFGTTKEQQKYVVQEGDTISDVSFNNKISPDEFLIANPEFKDENALLYAGEEVTIGILKPQFNLVEEDHVVIREEKNFETETTYDNSKKVGYSETIQQGVKGENRVTQKIQKVNGETTSIVTVNTEVLKEPITEKVVKGGKESYYSGGYGSVVATKGEWGWPATCSSVSSPFGYRWGTLHDGTDIAGCGYGSNIFASQNGTIAISSSKRDNGQYIVIDHHNGYYSMYAHLCVGCRYVSEGQNVVKGQVIGGMGQTGAATGVHLHYSIWRGYPYRGGVPLNPMSFY